MGQNLLKIEHGMDSASLNSTDTGGLRLHLQRDSYEMAGAMHISLALSENDAHALRDALDTYIASRKTKFAVGDIVYEPNHYKRAGEVIQILPDRVNFGAPYRVRFIEQAKFQPDTDYFAAEDLVPVKRKTL